MTSTTESAKDILERVGRAENVAALQHCSTRLRFNLVDDSDAPTRDLHREMRHLDVSIARQSASEAPLAGSPIRVYFASIPTY